MLTSISYIATASYETDGTVNLDVIPTSASASPPGFLWTENAANVTLPMYSSMMMIDLRYHNSLEDEDPYYRVTNIVNNVMGDQTIAVPAKTYYYIYTEPAPNLNDNKFLVFVNKDDQIICSLPEALTYQYAEGVAAAASYYDYDSWRISLEYMPNLVPLA